MIKTITKGAISGTGVIAINKRILGSILLNADGTNLASITLRETSDVGDIILQGSSIKTIFFDIQIPLNCDFLYYSIAGTGASAQIFEYIS